MTTHREHRIDLEPAPRGQAYWSYEGKRIAISNAPICAAARWLLNQGIAQPEDRVTTWRGETPCLTAQVGAAALLTIAERENGPRFETWKPWDGVSSDAVGAQDASGDVLATMVAIAFQNERSARSSGHEARV